MRSRGEHVLKKIAKKKFQKKRRTCCEWNGLLGPDASAYDSGHRKHEASIQTPRRIIYLSSPSLSPPPLPPTKRIASLGFLPGFFPRAAAATPLLRIAAMAAAAAAADRILYLHIYSAPLFPLYSLLFFCFFFEFSGCFLTAGRISG